MRILILVAVLCFACSSSNDTSACSGLRAHRAAIQAQMDAVNGNDDASIAAYNALVARSNKDLATLKAQNCALVG